MTSDRLNVYLKPDEKNALQSAADASRVTMNQYIRDALAERINDQTRFGDGYSSIRALWERLGPEDIEHMLYTLAISGPPKRR